MPRKTLTSISIWLPLTIGAFVLDSGLAEARLIQCGPGGAIYSDCLIITGGGYGRMTKGLTEADEAAGKAAVLTLDPRTFDFYEAPGIVSDIFSILTPVVITLQSDAGESGLPPAPPGTVFLTGESPRPLVGFRVESDTEPGTTSDFCSFPVLSDCVITRILNQITTQVLGEAGDGAILNGQFPGVVIDLRQPRGKGIVGDRLTIAPFSYSLVSDPSEGGPGLPHGSGDTPISGERVTIFRVRVRSDTDPVPEPGSLFLFTTGAMVCIGLANKKSRRVKAVGYLGLHKTEDS
jgi:hypothetical protein